MNAMNIAIIPARGGSQRIPRKNIKHFLGKPVITYEIKAVQVSGLAQHVVVSEEEAEIQSTAINWVTKRLVSDPMNWPKVQDTSRGVSSFT
jgi:pseudaminic acid cytidylyltransferase